MRVDRRLGVGLAWREISPEGDGEIGICASAKKSRSVEFNTAETQPMIADPQAKEFA